MAHLSGRRAVGRPETLNGLIGLHGRMGFQDRILFYMK
jgi:hypothetical protein